MITHKHIGFFVLAKEVEVGRNNRIEKINPVFNTKKKRKINKKQKGKS